MRSLIQRIGLSAVLILFLGASLGHAGEDLIAPTRSLEGPGELQGRLTVVSEPPGLEVFLDDSGIGQTPVWLNEVKAGLHKLRVSDSEKDVFVQPGRTLTLSYFKGSFIDIPEKKEAAREPAPELETLAERRERMRPREEARPTDLTPWEKFINRTSPNF